MAKYVATGLDGQNLLGFLCSLGAFALLAQRWSDRLPTMAWERLGLWRPIWKVTGAGTDDELVATLYADLVARQEAPEFTQLGDDLPVAATAFAEFAQAAAAHASPTSRTTADFAAAFGSEAVNDGDDIQDTAFRTMSGAGHQHFLRFIREAHTHLGPEQVREAIFGPWRYADERLALRWDPMDDRRYAVRASDPGDSNKSPILTVRAANCLAAEAIRFFPVAPHHDGAVTTSFARMGRELCTTWPIWTVALSSEAVRSLLSFPELTKQRPDRTRLRAMGASEVFRSRRFTNGRFRNFTPAVPV